VSVHVPDWLAGFLSQVTVLDALLAIAVIAAAVIFIKKKGWRTVVALAHGVINFAQVLEAVQGLPGYIERADARHERLEQKVDAIHHETHQNDGSSIKDAVGRIESALQDVRVGLDALAREDEALWAQFDRSQDDADAPSPEAAEGP